MITVQHCKDQYVARGDSAVALARLMPDTIPPERIVKLSFHESRLAFWQEQSRESFRVLQCEYCNTPLVR